MTTAKKIVEWFDTYTIEMGVEPVLKARQRLSVYCNGIADQIQRMEAVHKGLYYERKVKEAQAFLANKGTAAERERKAIQEELRTNEAKADGELKGLRIMLESYYKILDAMAAYINVLNR